MKKIIVVILAALLISASGCSSDDDNDNFKDLSQQESFKNAHADPKAIGKLALTGSMIKINVTGGPQANAYLVKSYQSTKKWLLVFHEWWGLNGYIKKEADKFANDFKDVNILAIDMYDGKVATTADEASKLVNEVPDSRIEQIVRASIDYMGDTSKFATLGWCFGGGWSLQTAIIGGKRDVGCVMYYGMPEKDMSKIDKIECPVLGIFAKRDVGITADKVRDFEAKMKLSMKSLRVRTFDAEHAFANPSNPHYDGEAAAQANSAAMTFLQTRYKEVY
jgi:carboxymethylenebutenolidase